MATTTQAQKLNPIARIKLFYEEVRTEMAKVAWPTKDDVRSKTGHVMMMLAMLGAIVAVMDFVFRGVIVAMLQIAGGG